MGILDKVTSLLPWKSSRQDAAPARAEALALRDDLDRWLDRVLADPWSAPENGTPTVSVQETDDELIVTAEVPGFDRDDLHLSITPMGLTIRGEAREEKEDQGKGFRTVASRYRSFARTVPLPPGVDDERAEAQVKRGVLTVRFPKARAGAGSRRIPIET